MGVDYFECEWCKDTICDAGDYMNVNTDTVSCSLCEQCSRTATGMMKDGKPTVELLERWRQAIEEQRDCLNRKLKKLVAEIESAAAPEAASGEEEEEEKAPGGASPPTEAAPVAASAAAGSKRQGSEKAPDEPASKEAKKEEDAGEDFWCKLASIPAPPKGEKQNICCFQSPKNDSKSVEAFVCGLLDNVEGKPPRPAGMDWGYVGGRPIMYVIREARPTSDELDALEQGLRDRGFKTYGGGLA